MSRVCRTVGPLSQLELRLKTWGSSGGSGLLGVRWNEALPCLLSRSASSIVRRQFGLMSFSDLESQNFMVHLWACDMENVACFLYAGKSGSELGPFFKRTHQRKWTLGSACPDPGPPVWKHPRRREGSDLVTAEKEVTDKNKKKQQLSYSDFLNMSQFSIFELSWTRETRSSSPGARSRWLSVRMLSTRERLSSNEQRS